MLDGPRQRNVESSRHESERKLGNPVEDPPCTCVRAGRSLRTVLPALPAFLSQPSVVHSAGICPLLTVCRSGSGITSDRVGGSQMDFYAILDQVIELLRQRQRVTYRALKVQFQLDDETLEALKEELIEAQHLAADETGRILVWIGDAGTLPLATVVPASTQARAPLAYTPPYLAEKILTSRTTLEGERKQVTVLFADLKDSTELIRGLDPEAAQQLLDPAIHRMIDAVHRFEGTVNQVLGDGIMAL